MNRQKIFYVNAILIVGFLFNTINSSAQVINLDSILNVIEKNHPELKMYEAQANAYAAYAKGAKALEPPQFGTGFFMTPYNPMMWKADGSNTGMGSVMFSAQQMFTNPKKLDANADYMQSMVNIEREMQGATRNEMFGMAKMRYYEWQVLKRKLKILSENEALLEYIIKSTEIRYTYGMDKLSAYYKAKAMLGEVQQMKLMAETEIRQLMVELNTLMARDKNMEFDIDSIFSLKNYDSLLVDSAEITSKRSEYRALSANINLLRSKQLLEYSKRLPDFGLRYDHMFTFGKQPQLFSLMAMMTVPIAPWSSRMYKSSITGLGFEIEALKSRQESLINATTGNLENIKFQIRNKKLQIGLYEKTIIPSLQKNYQTLLLAYEQNTEELFMVLDAWQNLKVSQLGYLDLLNDLLQLQVQYEKQLEIK
ncbi:MAG: TolC family protein [Bacteroidetes bacterium]|nr:TolC family protein [Bacteroidota bacterium]